MAQPVVTPAPPSRLRSWLNLVALGLGFTFIFTNFNALQNLETSLFLEHSDPGIGASTVAIIYAFAAIGCSLAPFILQILGTKWCLIFGAVSHALFNAAHFCSSHFTLFPAGAMLGLGTGVVWPSQGKSVTKFAEDLSAAEERPLEPVVSLFNGVFFCLFMSSQILGNVISSEVLKSPASNVTIVPDLSKCGANYCPSHPNTSAHGNGGNSSGGGGCEAPDSQVKTVLVIFLVSVGIGLVLWALLPNLSRLTKAERGPMNCKTISTALTGGLLFTFQEMKALLLAPMFFYTGVEQGIFFGNFTASFVTCIVGIDGVGLIAMVFGVADAVACMVAGKAAKLTGQSGMLAIGVVIQAAFIPLMLFKTPSPDETYIFYIVAAFWGISDAIWQTQTSSMVGVVFKDNQESAFACWRLWQQLGFCFSFATSPVLCTGVSLWIGLAMLVVAAAGLAVVEVKARRQSKDIGRRGSGGVRGGGKLEDAATVGNKFPGSEDEL